MGRDTSFLLAAIAAIAVFVLIAGALSPYEDRTRDVTWDDLVSIDRDAAEIAMSLEDTESVSIQNVTSFALMHSGVPQDIIRYYPYDWKMLSENLGLTDGVTKDFTDTADTKDLGRILANSRPLAKAFDGGITEPFFHDGLPQPVFFYTFEYDGYSNEHSGTIRYLVYVETEYDTDSDGKRDLIEVFLQVPRAAMEGGYKAPVILIASPYDHGPDEKEASEPADVYDMSRLRSQPDPRAPVGSMSAWDAAMATTPSDWYYGDTEHEYVYHNLCNYFIPRGYAVAVCGLLGSYGSEGYACSGLDLELLAVKSVIEWFDGDAVGYTSKDSLTVTEAEWCSGNVGMYGISYLGTVQLGVAAMGIDNLKTIIPISSISNWYLYVYQNGGAINVDTTEPYIEYMSKFISTARDPLEGDYGRYMQKLAYDEYVLKGQYTDGSSTFWMDRDYTRMDVDTDTSVMLIHGINDLNVKMDQLPGAMGMFKDSGAEMKVFLHQGGHQFPYNMFIFMLGDDNAMVTMNKWLSRYLFGQDTGVEDWPDIQVQSNLDGSWSAYDSLEAISEEKMVSPVAGTKTFFSDADDGLDIELMTADRDMTILGGEIRLRVMSETAGIPNYTVSVTVSDRYEEGMKAYLNISSDVVGYEYADPDNPEISGVWFGSTLQNCALSQFKLEDTTSKDFTKGSVGLGFYGETVSLESMRLQDREPGEYYDYVIGLNPTVYTLKEGHSIVVHIDAFDSCVKEMQEEQLAHYDLTVDMSSVELILYLAQ